MSIISEEYNPFEHNEATYFEQQNSQDCVIHSLNNAHGHQVITKPQVMEFIKKRIADYDNKLRKEEKSKKDQDKPYMSAAEIKKAVHIYKNKLSDGDTYFSANIVWNAAQNQGTVGDYVHLKGYSGDYADVNVTFMEWAKHMPVVVLGRIKGMYHAIAVRDGYIYDSEKENPAELTNENMKKSLDEIFGAYAFKEV